MKTLLITGAAGIVGTGLRDYLRQDYRLRLFDHTSVVAGDNETAVVGDIVNADDVDGAVQGVDAILHLACRHGETISFEDTLDVNYRGTIVLLDAALRHGVNNLIFASSNHGWGFYPRNAGPLPETAPPRPDGWYGINKIWAEAVLAHYSEAHGMTSTSLRIGNCGADVPDERCTHMWISFRDFAQLVRLSVERTDTGHRAVFATADCAAPFFDNAGAKAMGFVPGDRPEDNLRDPSVADKAPEDNTFGRVMGGSYAVANFRPRRGKPVGAGA